MTPQIDSPPSQPQPKIKGLSEPIDRPDGSPLTILIIHTRWNKPIIDALVAGAVTTLRSLGVEPKNILLQSVPGSYELPWACNAVLSRPEDNPRIDAIIAIGTLIKGDTMHFEYISASVSQSLMTASLTHNKPIIFGVLTCLTESQALVRAGLAPSSASNHNHGIDWAKAAVDCAIHARRWKELSLTPVFADSTSLDV